MSFQIDNEASFSWEEELTQLLAKPFAANQRLRREGKNLSLQVTSQKGSGEETVDIRLSISPIRISPPRESEIAADQVALSAFLSDLSHPNQNIRAAACRAIGQLGNASAQLALQNATQDENPQVQRAAKKALRDLTSPRLQKEDISALELVLFGHRQAKRFQVVEPQSKTITTSSGQAVFTDIPLSEKYSITLQANWRENRAKIDLPQQYSFPMSQTMAASSADFAAASLGTTSLPQSYRIPLGDESLLGTIYKDEQSEIVIDFRSSSSLLQNGWVYFSAENQATGDIELIEYIALKPDEDGFLAGSFCLSQKLSLDAAYKIEFEPIQAPPQTEEME